MNELFVSWQSPKDRSWHVVSKLVKENEKYFLYYVKGVHAAREKGFNLFGDMVDPNQVYVSNELFPFLKNRLLTKRRADYPQFISWLGLDETATDLDILGRSNGNKVTDTIQTFHPLKTNDKGEFDCYFFAHGSSRFTGVGEEYINKFRKGDKLIFDRELDNPQDEYATLVCEQSGERLGYCPRYLAKSIATMLDEDLANYELTVESTDNEAPIHYRLMCRLQGKLKNPIDANKLLMADYEVLS